MLRRSPGFAVVAILTLAIGIGANAAMFSVINTVLLKSLPFRHAQQVVFIWETDPNRNITRGIASPAELFDWRDLSKSFAEISAWRVWYYNLTGTNEPEQLIGAYASGNFFRMLGVVPVLGRDFSPEEEQPGHNEVAIITYGLWQRRFGGDPEIVGRKIVIDEKPLVVIGVLPRGFTLLGNSREIELWMPFAFDRAQLNREDHSVLVLAQLRDGVSLAQAQAEMETVFAQIKKQYPGIDQQNGVQLVRFRDDLSRNLKAGLFILLCAVAVVLLIACANIANLMLARAASREREIAVRASLGAGRRRIMRQLLTESALLALIGGALGVLFAYGGLHLLRAAFPPGGGYGEIPHSEWLVIDWTVLGFTAAVSLLTGLIFGLAPAIQISRSELYESLKEGGRGSTAGRRSQLTRSSLVVSEVAFSLLLLVGAGLLLRSFYLLMSDNLGFNPEHLLTTQVWLPDSRYPSGPPVMNFYQRVIDRLEAIPGVTSASAANFLPLSGWGDFCNFDIAGHPVAPADKPDTAQYRVADWRYLHTMGINVKQGRDFTSADGPDSQGVVILSESLVRRYWPGENPIGKQLRLKFPAAKTAWQPVARESWLTIVGIVGDVRELEWTQDEGGKLYLPYAQNPSRIMRLVIRSGNDPASLISAMRQAVASIDASQPITEIHTMDAMLSAAVSQRRLNMSLLVIFAGIATILAAIGIYGVMAYGVTMRMHEFGIRMALGAEPADVLKMVVSDGMKLAAVGLLVGIVGAALLTRYLESQLYGIKTSDPFTFVAVALGLALVAAAACYFPARRATKIDPLSALRHD